MDTCCVLHAVEMGSCPGPVVCAKTGLWVDDHLFPPKTPTTVPPILSVRCAL